MPQSLDNDMMTRALRVARRGLYTTDPNPRVGCVIVADDAIVGEGFTSPVGGPHAEINALQAAGEAARGATAYVTLEPCAHHGRTPPCIDALVQAGVRRVVYAIDDPNPMVKGKGAASLRAAGIEVASGIQAQAAREINIGFFKRMEQGLPWVTLKIGSSIDGKVALANGASKWITGEDARADVQRQRARSSAILTGIGTVLADDPQLTVRDPHIDMLGRNVIRIVCDSTLRMPTTARMLKAPGSTLIVTTSEDETRIASLIAAGAEVLQVAADAAGRIDLTSLLKVLATRGVNELLVEAGPALSGGFIERSLVDELVVYLAPAALGHEARSMFALPAPVDLSQRAEFEFQDVARVGKDLRVRLRPAKATYKSN